MGVPEIIINTLALGGIYVIFTLGFNLLWSGLGVINLAHGALAALAAIGTWYLLTTFSSISVALVVMMALVGTGLLLTVIDRYIFGLLWQRLDEDSEMRTLLASVGVVTILLALAERVTRSDHYAVPDRLVIQGRVEFASISISYVQVLVIAVSILATIVVAYWLNRTQMGRALRALSEDPPTAALMGINRRAVAAAANFASGVLAGLAGILLAMSLYVVNAHMGEPLMLKAIAIIVMAGIGSVAGAIIGGYLLAFGETMTVALIAPELRNAVAFGFVLLVLLIRPEGLFGKTQSERQ